MAQSREYVLQRLDKWYSDRLRRGYTAEFAEDLIKKLTCSSSASGNSFLNFSLNLLLSPEAQIESAKTCFTNGYAQLERIMGGTSLEGAFLSEVPIGIREEYVDPVFKSFRLFDSFVERVRDSVRHDFDKAISDSDIDRNFLETFGDYRFFSGFIISTLRKSLPLFDVISESKAQNDFMSGIIETAITVLPYVHERILGDLKKR